MYKTPIYSTVSIRMLYADEDNQNLVFYECEHELENGLCAEDGKFVAWYSRTTDAPTREKLREVGVALHDACVQPGDMVPVRNQGEGRLAPICRRRR